MQGSVESLYERLAAAASLEGDDAGVRVLARYEPTGGPDAKVFPPTYPAPREPGRERERRSLYLTERRYRDGEQVKTVLLDSTQSQANRCESALQGAIDSGRLRLPMLQLDADVDGKPVRITSLEAPHRSRDAYFRDSVLAGVDPPVAFDESPVGRALIDATEEAAQAYYLHTPADLVYGAWDSHRGRRRAVRFPRVYSSEIVGVDPEIGYRGAGRMDPHVLLGQDKITVPADDPAGWSFSDKGKRMTEHGHGVIPPTLNDDPTASRDGADPLAGGGAAVREIWRQAYLSFAGLARLRLGTPHESMPPHVERAGRATLAALALLGDRLAFARAALFLRSGCDLLTRSEEIVFVRRGGDCDPVDLDEERAHALLDLALDQARDAGLEWDTEPVRLAPAPNLQEALERALARVDVEAAAAAE